MRFHRLPVRGFSLLEVIIAVGLFATAVAVILALLVPLTRQAAASADTLTALRMPDGIRTEMQRLAQTGGFDALAGQAKPLAAPPPPTLALAASRDVTRLQSLNYLPPATAGLVPEAEQYFLIEAWTYNQAPLAFDPNGSLLAVHVRVSWPYFLPGATNPTQLSDREQVNYAVSLNR